MHTSCIFTYIILQRIHFSRYLSPKKYGNSFYRRRKFSIIFIGSVEQFSVLKIISTNCWCETVFYVSKNELCLNIHFPSLVGKSDKSCLTIDFVVSIRMVLANFELKLTTWSGSLVILMWKQTINFTILLSVKEFRIQMLFWFWLISISIRKSTNMFTACSSSICLHHALPKIHTSHCCSEKEKYKCKFGNWECWKTRNKNEKIKSYLEVWLKVINEKFDRFNALNNWINKSINVCVIWRMINCKFLFNEWIFVNGLTWRSLNYFLENWKI